MSTFHNKVIKISSSSYRTIVSKAIDTFVFRVKPTEGENTETGYSSDYYYLKVIVNLPDTVIKTKIYINNVEQTYVEAASVTIIDEQYPKTEYTEETLPEYTIKIVGAWEDVSCDYANYSHATSTSHSVSLGRITHIDTWYSLYKDIHFGQLGNAPLSLTIPNNVTNLNLLSLYKGDNQIMWGGWSNHYGSYEDCSLTLPNTITECSGGWFYSYGDRTVSSNLWIKDYILLHIDNASSSIGTVTIPANIKVLSNYIFGSSSYKVSNLIFDDNCLAEEIPEEFLGVGATATSSGYSSPVVSSSITISPRISHIKNHGLSGSWTSATFKQPAGMEVTLDSKCCARKTAGSATIYTDNETIKNYDWSGDNITATILHLDGTPWEE